MSAHCPNTVGPKSYNLSMTKAPDGPDVTALELLGQRGPSDLGEEYVRYRGSVVELENILGFSIKKAYRKSTPTCGALVVWDPLALLLQAKDRFFF
ncbi:hypothetical protein TorRG33x02_335640 [Trema orientale]|uniref:Uncharacterized protein n=1 Tax=Trema orientale TaxID=63057 RepID=A0A2P5B143_TREOI|nr:hypothetical protein TorRG33x02_335640 [Trema orientale]